MKARRDWDRGMRSPLPHSTRGFRSFWVFDEADLVRSDKIASFQRLSEAKKRDPGNEVAPVAPTH